MCLGKGDGTFSCSDVGTDTNDTSGVALGYVDNDGHLDAVFSNGNWGVGHNRVCLGDGAGGFTCSDVSADLYRSYGLAVGLVDANQTLDVIFADSGPTSRVCLGDGTGNFTCSDIADEATSEAVALGDVNGDDVLDAIFGTGGRNKVCLGDGTGSFACSDISVDQFLSFGVALDYIDDSSLIFSDGFESGDTSAWTSAVP